MSVLAVGASFEEPGAAVDSVLAAGVDTVEHAAKSKANPKRNLRPRPQTSAGATLCPTGEEIRPSI